MALLGMFQTSEADIIKNKRDGVIYVADFPAGTGKYISIAEAGVSGDLDVRISSRIHLRITYLTNSEKINGVEIAKVDGKKIEKIYFSTLDFERILQLLNLFTELDLKALTNKSVVFDESIIGDAKELDRFLQLVASDPSGKDKISEIAKNYELIQVGDIDSIIQKKEAVELFENILNNDIAFAEYKSDLRVANPEEVWQKFFTKNSWILGTDFVEILDERQLDVKNITDFLLKSYDGFVDIIELKLPTAEFWTSNNIPKAELTKATMQCNRYILTAEGKMTDAKLLKRLGNIPIAKPRITLIFGRSADWDEDAREAYRVLNSSYQTLNIITFDHLLERAKRITGLVDVPKTENDIKIENLEY